jgi:hypothetical protein
MENYFKSDERRKKNWDTELLLLAEPELTLQLLERK